jgi:hypothetical protein
MTLPAGDLAGPAFVSAPSTSTPSTATRSTSSTALAALAALAAPAAAAATAATASDALRVCFLLGGGGHSGLLWLRHGRALPRGRDGPAA